MKRFPFHLLGAQAQLDLAQLCLESRDFPKARLCTAQARRQIDLAAASLRQPRRPSRPSRR